MRLTAAKGERAASSIFQYSKDWVAIVGRLPRVSLSGRTVNVR